MIVRVHGGSVAAFHTAVMLGLVGVIVAAWASGACARRKPASSTIDAVAVARCLPVMVPPQILDEGVGDTCDRNDDLPYHVLRHVRSADQDNLDMAYLVPWSWRHSDASPDAYP